MSHEELSPIIIKMSETEAKRNLQRIFNKLQKVGKGSYSSDRFSKEVLEIYNNQYINHLFRTVDYDRTPHKFIK
jgi:hypothetical protein